MNKEFTFLCNNCGFEDQYKIDENFPIKSFPCPFCREGRLILQKD